MTFRDAFGVLLVRAVYVEIGIVRLSPFFARDSIMGKNQHVVPRGGQWGVVGAGNSRATSLHQTQADAIRAAREIAQNQRGELFIHRPNGQIRDRNSYGNDPYPPEG